MLAVNNVDGAFVEATAFLVCSEKRVPDRVAVNIVDGAAVTGKGVSTIKIFLMRRAYFVRTIAPTRAILYVSIDAIDTFK